jgi:peptidoglycan/LPS O-acetylase OafA/YrhL
MRYVQLDSLRGLAACSVVICHATNVLPGVYDHPERLWWFTGTPLAIVRTGHAAVIFFFVLSGFVLTLPFLKGLVSYPGFVVRRICRIWIPYATAMVVAVCCATWFYSNPVPGLSHWANDSIAWQPGLMVDHLLLVGSFDNGEYNPVVWSLVHEMRISLVFPLLILLLRLGAWWRVLGAAAALSVASLVVERLPLSLASTDLPITLHYAGLFVLGMVLARDMPKLQALYGRLSTRTKAVLWLLALLCYSHQAWLFPFSKFQEIPFLRDGLVAVGVTVFIVFALSSPKFSAWLEGRTLVFLGKVSYSIYLFHAVILLSLVHTLFGTVPLVLLWILTALLTLGIAALAYQLIEVPSIRLGRWVRFEPKLAQPQPIALSAPAETDLTPQGGSGAVSTVRTPINIRRNGCVRPVR